MAHSYYIDSDTLQGNYNTKFCFITSSYNQSQFINTNLESILSQDYYTYRIIYINDGSTDNSLEILNKFIYTHSDINIRLITNKKRMGPAYSRYIGSQETMDNEICVFLDGDDELASENVLSIIAEVYRNPNIHATFGSMNNFNWQFKQWQKYTRKSKHKFFPHLRTAKAYYAKRVPESYLKDRTGDWFMFCTDIALFTAIIELIDYKYAFIKNTLLNYNTYNSLNNHIEGYTNQNIINRHKRTLYHRDITNMIPLSPICNRNTETQFLIIRILGNDLSGLHGDTQTYNNLLFTLDNEEDFKYTDKVYILNRIINIDKKKQLQTLLSQRNVLYVDIPFDYTEFNYLPPLNINFTEFKKMEHRGSIIKFLYQYNQTIINNNKTRNFCIEYGKRNGYKWTFVLDSNSFFTTPSYNNIIKSIDPNSEYLIIPQKRLKDKNYTNKELLDNWEIENNLPTQEPQIAFKYTSKYTFNPDIPYGATPKAELLNALGVKGVWNNWGAFLKYLEIDARICENAPFQVISSVIRLHPHNKSNSMNLNWNKRMEGLYLLVEKLQKKTIIMKNNHYKSIHDINKSTSRNNSTSGNISNKKTENIQKNPHKINIFPNIYNFFN